MPEKPKTIPFGSAPMATTTKPKVIPFGVAPKAPVAPATPSPAPKENLLTSMVKGLFSAPATIAARPFQLGAELLMPGDNSEAIDKFSSKYSGGLIAPVPQNFKDVKKDVGRAVQTVALGTGAPIAGGAAFGAGMSLEQGNDLFSTETAFNTALGAGSGKLLGMIGKPLLSATGKVIGTITPQVLKDVAQGGTKSIQNFMKENQLLGGTFAPASEKIAGGFQKVDDAIDSGASKLFGGAKDVVKEQYPGLDLKKHYTEVNERDVLRPTTVNDPKYGKATQVYNDAKTRGIDLEKEATRLGIQHDKYAEGGKYNTRDIVDSIREGNYAQGEKIVRPVIKAAEYGVPKVPISSIRSAMLKKIDDIPSSVANSTEKQAWKNKIIKEYGDNSAEALAHPNGYSLTDLYDGRIVYQKNGKYKLGNNASDASNAELSREQARVYAQIFDDIVPEETGLKEFRKELEKNFMLADYLDVLHGKAVPDGITKKAVRLFGRTSAAILGGKIGGFPGAIIGSNIGDAFFHSFAVMPSPIKGAILSSLKAQKSPAYAALESYLGKKEVEKLLLLGLPEGGKSSFKGTSERLFSTPGGKATPVKQEAVDVASVELGKAKKPGTDKRRGFNQKVEAAQENQGPYLRPDEMPTIKMGRPAPKKKSTLREIYID